MSDEILCSCGAMRILDPALAYQRGGVPKIHSRDRCWFADAEVDALRSRAERAEAEVARLTAKVNALGDAVEEEGRRRRKAESADWKSVLLYRAAESRAVKAEGRAAGFECELLSAREALTAASESLHAAHAMLAAICDSDGSVDRRRARDKAWGAFKAARAALSPSPKGTPTTEALAGTPNGEGR